MKLVRFEDDTYGIRQLTIFGYRYYDPTGCNWWEGGSPWFEQCKTSEQQARKSLQKFKDKGTVVS